MALRLHSSETVLSVILDLFSLLLLFITTYIILRTL